MSESTINIFNENENQEDQNSTWSIDDVKQYVEEYMTYEVQIKTYQEARREWSAEFIKEKSLPKKELAQALSAAKKELDMDVVNVIYDNITPLDE
tara:strand:+ start:451 stop:735 length:285 start_codon:yes stop_codon:yes gene_type:complete